MSSVDIIIPFDFPFAILEHKINPDPNNKIVYAVADGQYTYGPLSLFQYNNDAKYSTLIDDKELPTSLPCREFYIIAADDSIEDAIEILDERRGRIYVKEISETAINTQKIINQSMVSRKERITRQSLLNSSNRSLNSTYTSTKDDVRTLLTNRKQVQLIVGKRSASITPKKTVRIPIRSQSVTTNRTLLKNTKSSGYGENLSPKPKQQLSAIITEKRAFRK